MGSTSPPKVLPERGEVYNQKQMSILTMGSLWVSRAQNIQVLVGRAVVILCLTLCSLLMIATAQVLNIANLPVGLLFCVFFFFLGTHSVSGQQSTTEGYFAQHSGLAGAWILSFLHPSQLVLAGR